MYYGTFDQRIILQYANSSIVPVGTGNSDGSSRIFPVGLAHCPPEHYTLGKEVERVYSGTYLIKISIMKQMF